MHWFYLSSQTSLDKVLLYTVTDQHIAFLVPYSCWGTVRNSVSIQACTEDIIKNEMNDACVSALFRPFDRYFWALYGKHNIRTLLENIKFICTLWNRPEKLSRCSLFYLFLKNVREYRRGLSREISNIGYTRRRKTNQKHNTIKASSENGWNITLGCRRFPCLVLPPMLDSICVLIINIRSLPSPL